MKEQSIIQRAAEDGLTLTLSDDDKIRISGDKKKIKEWVEVIRKNKSTILAELRTERGAAEQETKYSLLVTDASTDPVLVKVGIKGVAAFDLAIPRARYDGMALLEALEKHSAEAEPQRQAA